MNKKTSYIFNVEYAVKYGVGEAILLNNFIFWIEKNKADKSKFHYHETEIDGKKVYRYWTFNSKKALSELFPFWSEAQVKRILKSLVNQGIIIKGNFNANHYDRTLWYTLSDALDQIDQSYGSSEPVIRSEQSNKYTDVNADVNADVNILSPQKKSETNELSSSSLKKNSANDNIKDKRTNLHNDIVKVFYDRFKDIYGSTLSVKGKEASCVKKLVDKLFTEYSEDERIGVLNQKTKYLERIAVSKNKYQDWKFIPSQLLYFWNELVEGCVKAEREEKEEAEAIRRKYGLEEE